MYLILNRFFIFIILFVSHPVIAVDFGSNTSPGQSGIEGPANDPDDLVTKHLATTHVVPAGVALGREYNYPWGGEASGFYEYTHTYDGKVNGRPTDFNFLYANMHNAKRRSTFRNLLIGDIWSKGKFSPATSIPNANRYYGITGIEVYEKGDRPCMVKIYGTLLDQIAYSDPLDYSKRILGVYEGDRCNGRNSKKIEFNYLTSQPSWRYTHGRFVKQFHVCLSGSTRVKGMYARAVEIKPLGDVTSTNYVSQWERAHCYWGRTIDYWVTRDPGDITYGSCKSGEIVVGLQIYSEDDAIDWIDPICGEVSKGFKPVNGFN